STSFREDYLYRRFEDAARGSKEEVKESMGDLVDLLREHGPVLDVGCGRGELLESCREAGIEASGIDVNERSVAELQEKDFDVSIGRIPEALEGIESGSVGAVYASHVVEHLNTSALLSLMTESWRILRDGGVLVIETPNAQSLMVSGSEFWKDPSHVAPRHPAALIIVGREIGFELLESKTLHPYGDAAKLEISEEQPDDLQRLVDRLNEILFGDQDLRVVMRKLGR
ncbi:MAG: class I SAM-dependent methyltransferase, partial [Thermoanaerobaculia bacterium]|nr:class I SAM-dependent methyltransferase [Thermoanaerobaculia bacterium]